MSPRNKFWLGLGMMLLLSGFALASMASASTGQEITPSMNVLAPAQQTSFTLTVVVTPLANGRVSVEPVANTYPAGTVITLTALPLVPGARLLGWSGGGLSGNRNPITVTINSDLVITATFSSPPPTATNTLIPTSTSTPTRTPTRTFTPVNTAVPPPTQTTASSSAASSQASSSAASSAQSSSGPVYTITPLVQGVVAATATATPKPASALPSTGFPLTELMVGLALVIILLGARYLRQNAA